MPSKAKTYNNSSGTGPRVPVVPESRMELTLCNAVKDAGGEALKWPASVNAGVPDRIVILGGRTVFVEIKRPGGKTSPIQRHMHDRLRRAGADVRVMDSIDAIRSLINELQTEAK
jgi:hypothetical protein